MRASRSAADMTATDEGAGSGSARSIGHLDQSFSKVCHQRGEPKRREGGAKAATASGRRMVAASTALWLVGLLLPTSAQPVRRTASRPRSSTHEELLEQADTWLIDFDDDDDARLDEKEMVALLQNMKEVPSVLSKGANVLTVPMLLQLADSDGDAKVSRDELLGFMVRTKAYDGGHVSKHEASALDKGRPADYGQSHEQRMRAKGKKKKKGERLEQQLPGHTGDIDLDQLGPEELLGWIKGKGFKGGKDEV